MIKIMEASAGSGKTYNLAKTYIRLLLESDDPAKYRHILAVTFTNKATDEMKRRILKELHTLATDPAASPYHDDFVPTLMSSDAALQKKAQEILGRILHDYGAFAVSTIDRFFQQALKSFSREIGHVASYQVELDKNSLIDESVDRMLDNLSQSDKGLLRWLKHMALETLEENGKINLKEKVGEMARSLKSDRLCQLLDLSGITVSEMYSRENLDRIRTVCREVIDAFPVTVATKARAVMAVLEEKGLSTKDFYKGFLSAVEKYVPLQKGDAVTAATTAFIERASACEKWFSQAQAKAGLLSVVKNALEGPLRDFCAQFEQPYRTYKTALLMLKQIDDLGIARELEEQFQALLKEKNVLSLDDSNTLLRDIIDGSDAPFVYEKLGVRFEDFLLDEFQDTSLVQWDNFRPLLSNSEASGFENLVVGDVKQSIYRFRDSDWHLLADRLPREFPNAVSDPLRGNYRTLRRIVEFNNDFFAYAAQTIDQTRLYTGVDQVVRVDNPAPGSVDVVFKDTREEEMDEIVATIRNLQEHGAGYHDIAVLVRYNADGSDVAARLIREGIPIVSDDSLRVKSSQIVRLVVSALSLADLPPYTNKNGKLVVSPEAYQAWEAGMVVPSAYDSLCSLAEMLLRSAISHLGSVDGEIPYIQSFMDYLQNWSTLNGNDLSGFLKDWAENDPKISSPDSGDSVRIMTIHKSKGLEFPYVIIPFLEAIPYFRPDRQNAGARNWLRPALEGTPLEGRIEGFFRVPFNNGLEKTHFEADYKEEIQLQRIDNLNLLYVAMTRPQYGLKVIASISGTGDNMAKLLHTYKNGDYSCGEIYDFSSIDRRKAEATVDLAYPSWPLGDVTSGESRLKVSADAADFFAPDGTVGPQASQRLRGIAFHDILSAVRVPSDLEEAVHAAAGRGEIGAGDVESVTQFLRGKIASVQPRGWFPDDPDAILNEVEILGADGSLHRPDRVVVSGDTAIVVDYKFGEAKSSYRYQVSRYIHLLQALGYTNVSGYLWYIRQDSEDVIEQI